jgi:hypothetical protein
MVTLNVKSIPKLYNGKHVKKCECHDCLKNRLDEYAARVKACTAGGARPENVEQTIPVRAHFRRGKNHLVNSPELKALVMKIVKEILKSDRRH